MRFLLACETATPTSRRGLGRLTPGRWCQQLDVLLLKAAALVLAAHAVQETVMRWQRQPDRQQQQQQQQQQAGDSGTAAERPALEAGSACAAALAADLESNVDWEWLAGLRRAQRFGPVLRVELEVGGSGGLLPAAYDPTDRLVAQVAGRRRVLLLPPGQAFPGLYPYPTHHPYDRYSMVRRTRVLTVQPPTARRHCAARCLPPLTNRPPTHPPARLPTG